MKITSLVFISLVLMIAFSYTKVFIIESVVIFWVFVLWLGCMYVGIHLKNKDRNTPRPVYMSQ